MFSIQDILYGGCLPAAVAVLVFVVMSRGLPEQVGLRYASASALTLGFLAGYAMLALGPWAAESHWHWLPYALLVASVAGPIAAAEGVHAVERWLLFAILGGTFAWFLVPEWDDLQPSWAVHASILTIYIACLAGGLESLARRMPGPLLPATLWMTLSATAVALALSGSLRFAQIALAGAAAMFGLAILAWFRPARTSLVGSGFAVAVLAAGSLLIGRVNSFSEVPLATYLLIPLAPLALFASLAGPLSRVEGFKGVAFRLALPILLLGVAVGLAIAAEAGSDEMDYSMRQLPQRLNPSPLQLDALL
ncbi:hypothetical protein EC9_01880 [Rosistilla ulvae]|uniref:Uncharacterized protein n=1 Tax=Rosistilla ulvae TaxID=1930277 RepID=A0A517LTS8_9BACT|nr:hypothetical protein [Rosistilla ulvae]QDS86030.1 hypothetical protein EC9_01880 [Rosistilla ulvae]